MHPHFKTITARLRQVFFGPAYHPADHAALTPRGGPQGVRVVVLVVGSLWLSLVVFDNVARPWQRQPKSWKFFQGPRELNEAPNQPRHLDPARTNASMGNDIGVASLARPYAQAEDTTRVYMQTDAEGFRTVRAQQPFAAVLCGDSFSNNNVFADSLAKATGLAIGNQAIEGRGTLTMARYLEDRPAAYQKSRLVIWESTQRAGLADFRSLPERRKQLRQSAATTWQWRQSLLWPANIDVYLTGSSLLKPLLDNVQKEIKWALVKKHTDLVVLGRHDLPTGFAPMLYLGSDEAIRPVATTTTELDSIADYIATVKRELAERGQKLVFLVAPEKSIVYPGRLPSQVTARTNYITTLTTSLRQRGVYVVNLSTGLRKEAEANPKRLYYYTADTHWTPLGMGAAAHIIADSLAKWHLILPKTAVH